MHYRILLLAALVVLVCSPSWAGNGPQVWPQPTLTPFSAIVEDARIGPPTITASTEVQVEGVEVRIVGPSWPTHLTPPGLAPPTGIVLDPELMRARGILGSTLLLPQYPGQWNVAPDPSPLLNGLRAFFSTASGGFGFRFAYDRRLSPDVRFTAASEFLTYGYNQSLKKLGEAMPANVTRVTLVSFPVGFQKLFNADSRVVPHLGFGVGPILRFDHQAGAPGFYPGYGEFGYGRGGIGVSGGVGYPYGSGLGFGVGLPIEDFPRLSLTLGGFAGSGFSVRLGETKSYAINVEGRYTLARFFEAVGNPGDFSGFSVALGFGKYF